jgi:hypothetical protein
MAYVYYTMKRDDDHNDNKIFRWHIASGSGNSAPILTNTGIEDGKTYTLKLLADGRFLFTAKGAGTNDITELYMSSKTTDSYANLSTVQSAENSLVVGSLHGGFPSFDQITFSLPTERTARIETDPNDTAKILAVYNSKLYLCAVEGDRIVFGTNSIRSSVDEVVWATKERICVKSGTTINIINYIGSGQGGNISVSEQSADMPLSFIQPCDKSGGAISSSSSLIYMYDGSAIFLLDRYGNRHEIAINVKNNRPQESTEETDDGTTDDTATDDGTYTEEISLG